MDTIPNTALIIIDLQNDFLAEGCFSHKRGADVNFQRSILPNITTLCQRFRQNNQIVIWIHSIYGKLSEKEFYLEQNYFNADENMIKDVPPNSETLSRSHKQDNSNPCCADKTLGQEFYPEVVGMQNQEYDKIILKQHYSAFRMTNLLNILKESNVKGIVICGVATNYCCRATSVDGYHLGFNVYFVEDCIAASSQKAHAQSISEILSWKQKIHVIKSDEVLKRCNLLVSSEEKDVNTLGNAKENLGNHTEENKQIF